MKKQVILTSMLSLLAVSGVWAETVIDGNVTYSVGQITGTYSRRAVKGVEAYSLNAISIVDGYATPSLNFVSDSTITTIDTIAVEISSIATTTPTIASFKEILTTGSAQGYNLGTSQYYRLDDDGNVVDDYDKYAAEIIALNNNDYITYDQLCEANVTKIIAGETYDVDPSYDNIYIFYKKTTTGRNGKKTYSYYEIGDMNVNTSGTKFLTESNVYTPTTITSGTLFQNCTQVTLGVGVEIIEDGAFQNASSLNAFYTQTTKFKVSKDGCLYNEDYTRLIAVPSEATGTITLNNKCIAVDQHAMDNCYDVTLLTSDKNLPETTLSATSVANGNKIVSTNAELTKNGNVFSGYIYKTNLQKAIQTMEAGNSYDFTKATLMEEGIDIDELNLPTNVILFFADGAKISGTNVVVGKTCENLVLSDGVAYNNTIKKFNADNITFNRTFAAGNWATICLPFTWSLDKHGVWAGALKEYKDNTITFTRNPSPTANVPYLMKNTGDKDLTQITSSGEVEMSSTTVSSSSNGIEYIPTYDKMTVSTETYIYMYNTKGTLNKARSGNYLNPFRCYVTYGNTDDAAKIRMRFEDEFENEVVLEQETDIVEILNESENSDYIYNVNGQKVNETETNGIYVKNGKKIILK